MRARVGLAGIFAAFGIAVATFAARVPSIKHALGLTDGALAVALLGMPLGLILATRFAAPLVVRRSSASLAKGAMVALAAGLPLPGLAPDLPTLFATLVLVGFCLGLLDVAMNIQGVGLERTLGRPILNTLHGVYGVGFIAASAGGSAAAGAGLSPPAHFALASLVLLALLAWTLPGLQGVEADTGDDEPHPDAPGVSLRHAPFLVVVGLIGLCCTVAEGAVTDWSGVYLHDVQDASLGFAPLGAAAFGAGLTLGRFGADPVIARFGRAALLPRAALLGAHGMLLALLAPSPPVAVAGYVILGVGVAPIVPICFYLAATAPQVPSAWALSRVTGIIYVGLFIGPPLIGGLAELLDLGRALGFVVVLLVGAIGLSRYAIAIARR